MTDAQFAGVLALMAACGGGLYKVVSAGIDAWLTNNREDRTARAAERTEDRQVTRDNTAAVTELNVRVKQLQDDFESTTGVLDLPGGRRKKPRVKTEPMGVALAGDVER